MPHEPRFSGTDIRMPSPQNEDISGSHYHGEQPDPKSQPHNLHHPFLFHKQSSPSLVFSSAITFALTIVLMALLLGGTFILGSENSAYQFIFGEGGAHLLSQVCTLALFSWGFVTVLNNLISLNKELNSISYLSDGLDSSTDPSSFIHSLPTGAFLTYFVQELSWSFKQVRGYLNSKAVLEEAREHLLDYLEQGTRGIHAAMWLIPLSGFLGTVIGMSLTIGRFDELFLSASGDHVKLIGLTDLAPAIQGLSTAFDTTLLALALVIPLKLALVQVESRLAQFISQAEHDIGMNLMMNQLQQEQLGLSHHTDQESEQKVQESLQTLDQQTKLLNQSIVATATCLNDLKTTLLSHPSLSRQAQVDLATSIEQAIYQSQQSRGGQDGGAVHGLLSEVAKHQVDLKHQLNALQQTMEEPIILQRSSRSKKET